MELWQALQQVGVSLWQLLVQLLQLGLAYSLLIAYLAWWLRGVNWQKMWPTLAQGAWAPLVLLMLVGALVWSRIAPSDCSCLAFVTVPNFWWQLGAVGLLAAVALFCGWLQGLFGWTLPEIQVRPAAAADHGSAPAHH
jgi:hypothetical protein